MTSSDVAQILASKFNNLDGDISIIDAGAGIGSLTAALVQRALDEFSPTHISSHTWEIEKVLIENLQHTLDLCAQQTFEAPSNKNVTWNSKTYSTDFIENAVAILKARIRGEVTPVFNKAILNPPYLKISNSSKERHLLKEVGIEATNLYSCFVALSLMLLEDGGELVAITPRSFCNGPYFSDFRRVLLSNNALCKIHIFQSRTRAFKTDKVLQENVIFHIIKNHEQGDVEITSSTCASDPEPEVYNASFNEVVNPENQERFIHIVTNNLEAQIAKTISGLPCRLSDIGISASTGKVVDFRTKENLKENPSDDTVPLIFPAHFNQGTIRWPIENCRKPNAIVSNDKTKSLLIPNGTYVLTKRLTAKEENKRIVAALYTADSSDTDTVGFDNKTNYFHANGLPLDDNMAKGLWAYLNSTIVDKYFRQFNGHTQVNVSDLRNLRYPNKETLMSMGRKLDIKNTNQELIDHLVSQYI